MKPQNSAQPSAVPRPATLRTVAFALLAGAGIALGADLYAHFTTGAGYWPVAATAQSDQKSDSERDRREKAFVALGALRIQAIPPSQVSVAVETMHLPSAAKQNLLAAAAAESKPLRLAWITLWDTDVQDGDVVQINSQGYSRTITLTKGGETFAVPVPEDGIVKVTGVRDGDGGGITVGLASGAAKAVFPIMSTGQTLGLRVVLD